MKRLGALLLVLALATTLHAENRKKVAKETLQELKRIDKQAVGFVKNPPAGIDPKDLGTYSILVALDEGLVEDALANYYLNDGSRELVEQYMRELSKDAEDRPEPVVARPEEDKRPTT